MTPKVTVYVPCHNYGRFLKDAVTSVFGQIFIDWELLIINDGSTDNTLEVIAELQQIYPYAFRVFTHSNSMGLPFCANVALREAKGEYVMRLDADDYLDESALLTLSTFLDKHPKIGLVYPNYIYVDESGKYLGIENRKKAGKEDKIQDLPAHGACTMARKRLIKSIGGYSEDFQAQDGHEVWLKIFSRSMVGNVSTPLFFYRQHASSLSQDQTRVLNARQEIKRRIAEHLEGPVKPRIVAIVPAKNSYDELPNVVLNPIAGKPLIDYTIEAILNTGLFEKILVTTDDHNVLKYCNGNDILLPFLRDPRLSSAEIHPSEIMQDAIHHLENKFSIFPDILVILSVHAPLRRPKDICETIDTLLLYDVDTVTSVCEDSELHFVHGEHGMEPFNSGMLNQLRLEREALFTDNTSIRAIWRDQVDSDHPFGRTFGHIVMPMERSFHITGPFEHWLVEKILQRDQNISSD